MSLFSPINGLVGGSLIGLAASTLLVGNGDILGCSGIVSSIILNPREAITSKNRWKIVFVSTFLVTSTLLGSYFSDNALCGSLQESEAMQGYNISNFGYALAGFLVGFGSKFGNGCTSGHGICGLARLSIRSITAVLTFMATAFSTATFILPLARGSILLVDEDADWEVVSPTTHSTLISTIIISLAGTCALVLFVKDYLEIKKHVLPDNEDKVPDHNEEKGCPTQHEQRRDSSCLLRDNSPISRINLQFESSPRKLLIAATAASVFSGGLAVSGMVRQQKIMDFLDLKGISGGYWDGTLILVMGAGVLVSATGYHWVNGYNVFKNDNQLSCPLVGYGKFNVPQNKIVDAQLVLGAAIFGCGWGFAGLCPAPALFVAASGCPKVMFYWLPFNFIGTFVADGIKRMIE